MKRSDLLEIIIDEICNHEPISRKKRNIESAAEWILKKIEGAGMQPPGYSGRMANGKKYTPDMGAVDVMWIKTWEPED